MASSTQPNGTWGHTDPPASVKSEPTDAIPVNGRAVEKHVCFWKDCLCVYSHVNDLVEHMRVHVGSWPYVCRWSECTKNFGHVTALQGHVSDHLIVPRMHQCDVCEGIFPSREAVLKHALLHELVKEETNKPKFDTFAPSVDSAHLFPRDPHTRDYHKHMEDFSGNVSERDGDQYLGRSKRSAVGTGTIFGRNEVQNGLNEHTVKETVYGDLRDERERERMPQRATHVKTASRDKDKTTHREHGDKYRASAHQSASESASRQTKQKLHKTKTKKVKSSSKRKHSSSGTDTGTSTSTKQVPRKEKDTGTRNYRCDICWSKFPSAEYLDLHIQGVHSKSSKPYPCTFVLCTQRFASCMKLSKHLGIHDSGELDEYGRSTGKVTVKAEVKSKVAAKKPVTKRRKREVQPVSDEYDTNEIDMQWESEDGSYKRVKTNDDDNYAPPMKTKYKKDPRKKSVATYKCSSAGCGRVFATERGLWTHKGKTHKNMRTSPTQSQLLRNADMTTSAADTVDMYPTDIQVHIPSKRDKKVAMQKQAQMVVTHGSEPVEKHSSLKTGSSKQKSKFSRKAEDDNNTRSTHVKSISAYVCDCGMSFCDEETLQMHRRIHQRNKPVYECPYKQDGCTKAYDTSMELIKHLTIHEQLINISSGSEASPQPKARTKETSGDQTKTTRQSSGAERPVQPVKTPHISRGRKREPVSASTRSKKEVVMDGTELTSPYREVAKTYKCERLACKRVFHYARALQDHLHMDHKIDVDRH